MNVVTAIKADDGAAIGHNEIAVRLGLLANDAQLALDKVARGEGDAIDGWLAYGAALNEGRGLFPSDELFGKWVDSFVNDNLSLTANLHERAAAMWAAAFPDQFDEARAAGNARTVRGIHAKWNEINAERVAAAAREAAEKAREEAKAKAEAEAKAKRKEQEARDEEERKAAEQRRIEAEKAAAKAAEDAKKADKTAVKAEKKAEKVRAGNTSKDDVRGTTGTGENEWYTPAAYIEAARSVLGDIDLDPASSEVAQRVVKAAKHFTIDDNGLLQHWNGRVWLNPPYAQPHIANFADKMVDEVESGEVTAAIMLTHNYTDTTWFHRLASAADAICFTRGRIRV
ncbi:MAG: DNA N-6-adenine-methyltransferase, partial [Pseudaminobacter sp.]